MPIFSPRVIPMHSTPLWHTSLYIVHWQALPRRQTNDAATYREHSLELGSCAINPNTSHPNTQSKTCALVPNPQQ